MRFNKSAFTTGFFLLLLINLVFAGIIYFIIDEFNIQFQETHFLIIWLLFLPPAIFNILWFVCVIKYFSNGTNTKNKRFARPSGDIDRSAINKLEILNHKTKINFLIGSIFAFIISSYVYYLSFDSLYGFSLDSLLGQDKRAIRSIVTPVFTDFGSRLEKYLNNNTKTDDAKTINAGTWQSVFTSDLNCFSPEKKVYDDLKAMLIIDQIPMMIIGDKNGNIIEMPDEHFKVTNSNIDIILIHKYEYWIDPEDPQHFKLRFKTRGSKSIVMSFTTGYAYDYTTGSFNENLCAKTWLLEVGYFVYDSNTDEMRFEYSSSTENFFEHYKIIFYIIWYLFVIIISIGTVILLKRLSTAKGLQGQRRFVRSRKMKLKPFKKQE